jgi:hypothetical protein
MYAQSMVSSTQMTHHLGFSSAGSQGTSLNTNSTAVMDGRRRQVRHNDADSGPHYALIDTKCLNSPLALVTSINSVEERRAVLESGR